MLETFDLSFSGSSRGIGSDLSRLHEEREVLERCMATDGHKPRNGFAGRVWSEGYLLFPSVGGVRSTRPPPAAIHGTLPP
jgi:hypothetical protein